MKRHSTHLLSSEIKAILKRVDNLDAVVERRELDAAAAEC